MTFSWTLETGSYENIDFIVPIWTPTQSQDSVAGLKSKKQIHLVAISLQLRGEENQK